MVPTPTVDRLAAPPTVENPTQADEGAQLFWLHCQPCHGDRGQGLTDEWRAQYPEEDQNCWTSGCHGDRPYENGFSLPTRVPAVIGQQSLERFETMGQVYAFMRAAMPFQDPGHLSQEEFLAITAFLARAHGLIQNGMLTDENVHDLRLKPAPTATSTAANGSTEILLPTISTNQESPVNQLIPFGVAAGIMVLLMAVGGVWLWRRNKL